MGRDNQYSRSCFAWSLRGTIFSVRCMGGLSRRARRVPSDERGAGHLRVSEREHALCRVVGRCSQRAAHRQPARQHGDAVRNEQPSEMPPQVERLAGVRVPDNRRQEGKREHSPEHQCRRHDEGALFRPCQNGQSDREPRSERCSDRYHRCDEQHAATAVVVRGLVEGFDDQETQKAAREDAEQHARHDDGGDAQTEQRSGREFARRHQPRSPIAHTPTANSPPPCRSRRSANSPTTPSAPCARPRSARG